MIHKIKKVIPQHEFLVESEIECDSCHKKTNISTAVWDGNNWSGDSYNFHSTVVRIEKGSSSREGGYKETYEIHLCPECFRDIIGSALKARGLHMHHTESDW